MTTIDGNGAVDDPFSALKEISRYTRRAEQDAAGRELLIRFLDRYSGATAELPIVDTLCAHFGLFPYMSPDGYESAAEALGDC